MDSFFGSGELYRRVGEKLGGNFHRCRLTTLVEGGHLVDDFPRVAGRRLFRQRDVGRIIRAVKGMAKSRVERAVRGNAAQELQDICWLKAPVNA